MNSGVFIGACRQSRRTEQKAHGDVSLITSNNASNDGALSTRAAGQIVLEITIPPTNNSIEIYIYKLLSLIPFSCYYYFRYRRHYKGCSFRDLAE